MVKKILCGLAFSSALFSCYANETGKKLAPIEASRLRMFEILYPKDLQTLEKKQSFAKAHYKAGEEYETYTFPNKTIDEVYNAYKLAHPKDSFGASILHKELPRTNKAYKAESNEERMGYVLLYIWNGENRLEITNTRIDDENLCGKESLQFEQNQQQTILKSSFEQYCF